MLFKSAIFSQASGSVAGCTYSHNRAGMYTRNRSLPVNPNSTEQQAMRGALATLVARWTSVLDADGRAGWTTWGINTPQTNKLGDPFNLTGQQAYIKMNAPRIQVGLSIIDTAPTDYSGAVLTPPVLTSADAAADEIDFTFSNADEWANFVGGALLLYTSRPQNASKLSFAGPYRYAGRVNGAVSPPASPQTIPAAFPFATDQRVHCLFRCLNADGRISTAYRTSIIAA